VAADVMVQEYGRYFGMPTCCLRGGCLTGPNHSGVELHGFLSYLVKCNLEGREYRIYGYKGKQVRDNIHSLDVARFMAAFVKAPRAGEVYNLGGGKANSTSILEAFQTAESLTGRAQVSHLRGPEPDRRPHLLLFRPQEDAIDVRGSRMTLDMRKAVVSHQPAFAAAPVPIVTNEAIITPRIVGQPVQAPVQAESPETAKQERDARMLVSDLMDIGMQQRKAVEEAKKKEQEAQEAAKQN
jgi:hypothetical protein